MPATTWKEALAERIPADWGEEIDVFESQMAMKRGGRMDDKVFAETRLRRGCYGQRYDNGQRFDGRETRKLAFPSGELTKGPMTYWDAPGMQRIKIPYGGVSANQLEVLAELAEEYSDGILHVTTRQDIQLHFIALDDTPDLMRRLAAVGITTREACGNTIRNVTACPKVGACATEVFDTRPYIEATFRFLLGHKDCQDFGRKFKVAFSGCREEACGLAMMHDAGLLAKTQEVDGAPKKGFEVLVGGGLGAVPYLAKPLYDFLPEEELLPTLQAVCRVFARDGEKKNRSKARVKFLIADVGIDEFRRRVEAERKILPHDERWTAFLADKDFAIETPALPPAPFAEPADPAPGFAGWLASNCEAQKQDGYHLVRVTLPLGDFTPPQARRLADLARRFVGETTGLRFTVDQNLVFRFIPGDRVAELHRELAAIGLAQPGAGTIADVTACPGTDTCKLGIASSRGLAAELEDRLRARLDAMPDAVKELTIKVSGCFNSCAQHHISDLGFYGVSRKRHGRQVPFFQMFLGGQTQNNAGSYGLAAIAIPAKKVPEAVDTVTAHYVEHREGEETFLQFVERVGKKSIKELVRHLAEVPETDESFYHDWHDQRSYTSGDMGVGECAGELVETVDFGLSEAERTVFDAQVALDAGDPPKAAELAVESMIKAAKALVYTQNIDVGDDPKQIEDEFRSRLVEPRIFHDRATGDRFARYFFNALDGEIDADDADAVHHRIEEATLFIEAAHACHNNMATV